jgi:ATP-dependent RNA/DNA helicase IGHMBP2
LHRLVEQDAEGTDVVRDVRKELETTQKKRSRCKDRSERRELQAEERRLRKEIKIREERVVQDVLKSANVVCTTNVGAAAKVIQKVFGTRDSSGSAVDSSARSFAFDLVVIDEVAQALEASCWVPLLLGARCVLAGDHCQVRASDETVFMIVVVRDTVMSLLPCASAATNYHEQTSRSRRLQCDSC